MRDQRRHAVYFVPRPGPLAAFGSGWLGWDAETATVPAAVGLPGLPRPRSELTATPGRYGFHATLKAPFRLAGGDTAALDAAVAALAAGHAPFELRLEVAALGAFLALVPVAPPPALGRLADACVTRLDRFRAPAAPDEDARRRAAGLDAAEAAHLERWGYPYVLDRFRFHMTLTGPLAPGEIGPARATLAAALAPLLAAPVPVLDICRCTAGADERFRIGRRHALGLTPAK